MSGPSSSPWKRKRDPDDQSGHAATRNHGVSGARHARKLDDEEPVDLDAGRPAQDPGPDVGLTMDGVQGPRPLKPTLLPERPTVPRRWVPFGMFGGFACAMAAAFLVGRELAVQGPGSPGRPIARGDLAVASQPAAAVIERTISIPPAHQLNIPPPQLVIAQTPPPSASEAAPRTVPEPAFAGRQLDVDEIASLLNRGEQFVAKGDLAAARSLFERAAEAGDARAAFALAETYDPIVLQRRGEQGFAHDIAVARTWYERAREFGSSEASERLQMLASEEK